MPASEDRELLVLSKVSAGYYRKPVINDVTMTIERGDIAVVLGANGSGKSTLFKAIVGLLDKCEGEIRFGSRSISGLPPHDVIKRGISYLLQDRNIYPDLTLFENLRIAGYGNRDKSHYKEQVLDIIPEIGGKLHSRAGLLSGGERQLLAIAMVLMRRSSLVLLDEPSAGLSPQLVTRIFDHLNRMNDAFGTTLLIIEQNIRAVLAIATKVLIMKNGKLTRHTGSHSRLLEENLSEVFFS